MNKEIGALWKNTSAKGNEYFAGNIEVNGEKIKIVVFHNRDSSESNHFPDYRIYESKPMENAEKKEPNNNIFSKSSQFSENNVNDDTGF